tara:strand:- start:295 stop:468 length:174 start_codon:yes stop_codon:yes gene_type:complete
MFSLLFIFQIKRRENELSYALCVSNINDIEKKEDYDSVINQYFKGFLIDSKVVIIES